MYVTKEKTDESCYCKMVPCERLPQRQEVYNSNTAAYKSPIVLNLRIALVLLSPNESSKR